MILHLLAAAAISAAPASPSEHLARAGQMLADHFRRIVSDKTFSVAQVSDEECPPADKRPLPRIPAPPQAQPQVAPTAAIVTRTSTADPPPAPPADPLVALMQASVAADAELSAATAAEDAASARKQTALSASASASKAFADEWTKRHPLPTPTPVPAPVNPPAPDGPAVSLLAITASGNWCPGCNQLRLALAGLPVTLLAAEDQGNWSKWKVSSVPTMVMLVNGQEVSRVVGSFDQAAIKDWIDKTNAWAKLKYPPPKLGDEVPPPPRRMP